MDRRDFCIGTLALAAAPAASQAKSGGKPGRRAIAPAADRTYAQAHEVAGATRILFVSGQVPADGEGAVPEGFRAQCRLAWDNVGAQLKAAGMDYGHLAKVTIYLADRRYRDEAREVRQQVLGKLDTPPALTVIVADIFDEAWLLEIEAVALA